MENLEEYILVKSANPIGYDIMNKETRDYLLLDDFEYAKKIIEKLLIGNVRIYENHIDYEEDFPQFTSEERKEMSMQYWSNIPENMWPKEVREFFKH